MAEQRTILVGTVGSGVWHSSDGGEHWRQSPMNPPFEAQPGEIQIRSLAVAPWDSRVVLAGSEVGLYRSDDGGAHFSPIEGPMYGQQIWSLALHPDDPETFLVGTKPPGLYRTRDAGKSWERLPLVTAEECFAGPPKVTCIVYDPRDPRTVWVSVEIDGIYQSRDGGDNWLKLPPRGDQVLNDDMHCLAVSSGEPTRVHATTPDGIWTSEDEGESWSLHAFPRFFPRNPISYCRGVALKPGDSEVIFVANGNTIPGRTGAIQRSTDGGVHWQAAELPVEPNSTIYWFATHPADPEFIVANSLFGYLYASADGGDSWQKLDREFGEIRALAWVPTP